MINRERGDSLLTVKKRLGLAVALLAAGTAIFLFYQSQIGRNESEQQPSEVVLSAYLNEETVELSKEKDTTYEVKLLMDDFPVEQEVVQIRALLNIPAAFEVDAIVPNPSNVSTAAVAFQLTEEGLELRMGNDDGSLLAFANLDGSKELATITLKQTRGLIVKMNKELKVSSLEIVDSGNKSTAYDVSGASTEMVYEPPASAIGKLPQNGNPLVSHKFGADPYAIVYNDRVYIYSTYDVLEYDEAGEVKDNTYGSINRLSIVSSSDLMNWTDHGFVVVAGSEGEAKWATQSWAPAAAHKVIDGKDKFFLYFANNASGIGVLSSDSPTGPWIDPIGKPLIARSAPEAEGVTWLFDPAVLVDDDGTGYIYFGGGIPEGKEENPDTARVMQLGDDMISVVGEAAVIPAPFMFEDAGINKVGGTYYYTYCSNFYGGVRPEGSPPAGEIAYMTSDHPMGPWTYQGTILKNPGHFFGVGGNNHHAMFQFHDEWYIAYHAQTLSKAMGVPKGYRSTHLNKVSFGADGVIGEIEADLKGVPQLNKLNPFIRVEAETLAWSAGIDALPQKRDDRGTAVAEVAIADIHNGDWTAVAGVDFGDGASTFTAYVAGGSDDAVMELRLDSAEGVLIGALAVPQSVGSASWAEVKTAVAGAEGVHDLYFVFKGKADTELFTFNAWQFGK
ncbi:glycoside hydrolase family 43 protein [Paenibacillus sp. YIM B09110]|uniref:glycoside hydrolase family 43 protein n=1 Tax=Paenibacillus sp. YIM B09110 TaxID=3126102 RepID=UPI00301DF52C